MAGVARNGGAGIAQNVVVEVAVDLGSGIPAPGSAPPAEGVASVNLGDLAAGATKPYTVKIPIGDRSVAADPRYRALPHWDNPALDTSDLNFNIGHSGSHVIDNVTGNVRNTGKGPAPNTAITFVEAAGQGGVGVLGSTTVKVGDVPAGANLPFQLAVDLGDNPPPDVYYHSTFDYDSAHVADEQETARRVGGTLTVTGFLHNSGAVPALTLVLGSSLLDGGGASLASASSRVGSLSPGARAPYELAMDLGEASPADIRSVRITLSWRQVRFLVLSEARTQSVKEAVPSA